MAVLSVGNSPTDLHPISPDPQSLQWGLQDISASDAGRVHDPGNTMYKMRTSQKRKLNISWVMPTANEAANILQSFNAEYFYVQYWDVMDNKWEVREFYAGDRSAPFKWMNIKGTYMSTLSFDIIER